VEHHNKKHPAAAEDKMKGRMTVGTAMIGDPIDQDGSPTAIATTNEATAIMTAALVEMIPIRVASAMNVRRGMNKAGAKIGHAAMNTITKRKNNTLLTLGMINSMWTHPIMTTHSKIMANAMICIMIPTPAAKTAVVVGICQST
jgi:hypothetical protein